VIVVIENAAITATRRIAHGHDVAAGNTSASPIDTAAATAIGAKVIDHLSDFAAKARLAHPPADGESTPVLVSRASMAHPSSTLFRHGEPPP
jgi:hypothetical protein